MNDAVFPAPVAAAMDRLTVPPLPAGFRDRLLARAGEAQASLPPLPAARKRTGWGSGWRRSGWIIGSAASLGLATATAAASGAFGDPVYVPVVSETLATAKLVELPGRAVAKPAPEKVTPPAKIVVKAVPTVSAPEPEVAALKGKQAVRDLYKRLRTDPEYQALSRPERVALARQELRTMLAEGRVTMPELQQMLRQSRANREIKAAEGARPSLRERTLAQAVGDTPQSAPGEATSRKRPDPAQMEARRNAFQQLPPEQKARVRELREQLRTATPEEKPAIRRELRGIWKATEMPQSAKNLPPAEDTIDLPR